MDSLGPVAFTLYDLIYISPILIPAICALLILLTGVEGKKRCPPGSILTVYIFSLAISIALSIYLWGSHTDVWNGMLSVDALSLSLNIIIAAAAMLTIFVSLTYERSNNFPTSEYYFMIMIAATGMMLMAASTNLIMIFISLELFSIALYILAGFIKGEKISQEASLKYFFMGAFASGFLLFGIAFTYGAVGSLSLDAISFTLSEANPSQTLLLILGFGLIFIGFAFKIGLVPFHKWVPDVYEGAPTSITAFMSVATKAAAFASLLRVAVYAFPGVRKELLYVLWTIAIITMIYGNITALFQTNIKRLLAYSGIAQAGYILIPFVSANHLSVTSVIFYLFIYTFANIGAFGVVMVLGSKKDNNEHLQLSDYKGLGFQHPAIALCMSVFLLSLAGFPPTGGFIGKFFLFASAVEEGFYFLAIIGILTSVISVYYYIRIIVYMYMQKEDQVIMDRRISGLTKTFILLACFIVLILGIYPSPFFHNAMKAITAIFPGVTVY